MIDWNARRDGDLLRLYTEQGEEAAFTELGRRHARLIYSTCLRELGDRTLAEDAAQGVLLLLSQKASALQRHDNLAGWLYIASRNVARNLLKQERRRKMTEARAMTETAQEPDSNPLWERIEPHFHAALDCLKPVDRAAILLRFVEEQSLAEVGTCLGLTENTARMRINRALERIRKNLGRAGIALTVGTLALLLERHSACAAPARVLQSLPAIAAGTYVAPASRLTDTVRRTGRQMTRRQWLRPVGGIGGVLLLLMGGAAYRQTMPQRLNATERRKLYAALAGDWQGTLEFADDRTGQHFTYGASVAAGVEQGGDTFRFTATYPRSSSIDTTTLRVDAIQGGVEVYNGGPRSSHSLSAHGDLFRLRNGSVAFLGFSAAQNRDVRLLFALQRNELSVQEEYRRPSRSEYQFRNHFVLRRR